MTPSGRRGGDGPFVLAIASGKGGTGKTLVSSNLAALEARAGHRVVLVDCDVEAPNDHLFLPTAPDTVAAPVEVTVAEVDAAACSACGSCRSVCAYGAVRLLGASALVFEEMCHGCGACLSACPDGAIRDVTRRVGEVSAGTWSESPRLSVVTGRLDVGEVKAPAVIVAARRRAEELNANLVVLDAPPGVACSAVAAVRHADAMLLVTEPTQFGLHDLELGLRMGCELGLPMAALINRDGAGEIDPHPLLERYGAPVLGRLPFDRRIAETYARGHLVASELPEAATAIEAVAAWTRTSRVRDVVAETAR